MINAFFPQHLADYAQKALLYEVTLSPKPGLVDPLTTGAHTDMDVFTFMDSIVSLRPFLEQYVAIGISHQGEPAALFKKLRKTGASAEEKMLQATNNVNTHKGANFSFAVILGATGFYLQNKENFRLPLSAKDSEAILALSSQMTQHLVLEDFVDLESKPSLTYGEKLYLTYGITGIRGEAAAGYPSLSQKLLPYLRKLETPTLEETLLRALIFLMSEIEDSNLLHRGGFEAWKTVKAESKKIHQAALDNKELLDELRQYDMLLTQRHLSPGGSADLLALGIYFAQLEGLL
ncbi:triphosphoribosyl-dephospho-CoA synthase CitG [Enterococcus sp. BWT-B8]|nr:MULTISPECIES: triphosphoribosyl-dephospho-CoA synthase CitG [unclassified Enterococcus]MCB5953288.1 triphosphoribosyl-dephospho-CoA synthase CitG [Enterococcus sp. BWT-B8]MCB5955732.1 triphosphoribosyl-dephospho-CoA synthase CitG [Enterococcus sp. CWB-B31]